MAPSSRVLVRQLLTLTLLFGLASACACAARPTAPPAKNLAAKPASHASSYGKLPLSFEANQGQTDPAVKFLSRGRGYSLFLTDSAAILSLPNGHAANKSCRPDRSQGSASLPARSGPCAAQSESVRMELAGANPQVQIAGAAPLPGVSNYFLGNDPAQWRTSIPNYAKVQYSNLYPGIDLVYYGNQSQLEYDFVVAPGANPDSIRLNFSGQKQLQIAASGDLILQGSSAQAALRKPVVYQEKSGRRQPVPARFELAANHSVRFRLGKYDHSRPLVIDPVLTYATYIGGSGPDTANAIAVDSAGEAFITGSTRSLDFPVTAGAYATTNKASGSNSGTNVFVSKFNATGTALLYSTYLGGSGIATYNNGDLGNAIAIDSKGNAYVAGTTFSADFPTTPGAFQTVNQLAATQCGTGFVTRLNATGTALVYSTFLGGGADGGDVTVNQVRAIAVDSLGDAFVTGATISTSFPVTPGAFQQTIGLLEQPINNAFVTKLNPAGSALLYSTYLGGSTVYAGNFAEPGDIGNAIVVDSKGDAYVAGRAATTDFPTTPGVYQTINAGAAGYTRGQQFGVDGSNAFVTKLNPTASALLYSTFLGGSGDDQDELPATDEALSLAVDRYGDAFVAGVTNSTDFPNDNIYLDPNSGHTGAGFVSRLTPDASSLYYSTLIGENSAGITSIAVDLGENAYIAGDASGNIVPTVDAIPSQLCCAFVAKLTYNGANFEYSTYLGGAPANSTVAKALAIDGSGNVYVTGSTSSTALPVTAGAYQSTNKASAKQTNAYVAKLALAGETTSYITTVADINRSPSTVAIGQVENISAELYVVGQITPPTGSVTFTGQYTNPNQPGVVTPLTPFTAPLNGGTANWQFTPTAIGQYQVIATYLGNAIYSGSQSIPVTFTAYGPPAKLYQTEYETSGDSTYGDLGNVEYLGFQVTDAFGTGLSGVTINLSPTSNIAYSPFPAVTGSGGYVVVSAQPLSLGEHVVTASVTGIAAPIVFPAINTTPAPLTVTVLNNFKVYGAPVPANGANVSGLRFADTVNVVTQASATAASPVGAYPVTATVSGADAGNYNISVIPGVLTVIPAYLNIAAKNVAVLYGQTPPQPTAYLLSGFVNGDTASVVTGAPVLSTSVTATTPVGSYPIGVQVGSLSAANYRFSTVSSGEGSVTVYKAPLNILPNSVTIHAGDPLPTFTYTLSGFVNGDTQASATTGAPVLTTAAASTSTPGRYYIYAKTGTLAAANYTFIPPNQSTYGILTILPN